MREKCICVWNGHSLCLRRGHVTEPFWSHGKASSHPNMRRLQMSTGECPGEPQSQKVFSCKSWNVSVQRLNNCGIVLGDKFVPTKNELTSDPVQIPTPKRREMQAWAPQNTGPRLLSAPVASFRLKKLDLVKPGDCDGV